MGARSNTTSHHARLGTNHDSSKSSTPPNYRQITTQGLPLYRARNGVWMIRHKRGLCPNATWDAVLDVPSRTGSGFLREVAPANPAGSTTVPRSGVYGRPFLIKTGAGTAVAGGCKNGVPTVLLFSAWSLYSKFPIIRTTHHAFITAVPARRHRRPSLCPHSGRGWPQGRIRALHGSSISEQPLITKTHQEQGRDDIREPHKTRRARCGKNGPRRLRGQHRRSVERGDADNAQHHVRLRSVQPPRIQDVH